MQINLINGFYIETDNRNFTLKQKYIGTRKDGTKKEAVKIIGHCGSLEQALETFLRMNQIPQESKLAVDLMEYAYFIKQSNKEAVQALKAFWRVIMRLIDADALKDTLLKYRYTTAHNQIFRYIDEQQTAYDVDKVVEQLEENSFEMGKDSIPVHYVRLNKAIEIVKGGGADASGI